MPGGNTSSRKKPYRTLKDAASAYDNHALAGGKFYETTMSSEPYIDSETGYPHSGAMNLTPDNVDGNAGFKSTDVGSPVVLDRNPKRTGNDPTPGGGFPS